MTIVRRFFSCGVLLGAALGVMSGCVERKISIGSDPNGAIVVLNDLEVGRTPLTVPFTWYGDYDIRLSYEKNVGTEDKPVMKRFYLHTHKRTKAPVFQWLGVDLLAELSPVQFKDDQVWAFAIPEVVEPSNEVLIQRAEELKDRLGEPVSLRPEPKTQPATKDAEPKKK